VTSGSEGIVAVQIESTCNLHLWFVALKSTVSDFVNNYDTFHLGPSSNAKCWKIWWQNQCVTSAFCWRTHVEYLHHNITHNLSATRSFTVLLFDTFNFTIDKPSWFITRFPGYPNLLYGTYTQYLLQFCPSQVKTCFGCGQALKSGGELARPPCDLVIVSNAKRAYYNNAGTLKNFVNARFINIY
jgi:hypothetical protein